MIPSTKFPLELPQSLSAIIPKPTRSGDSHGKEDIAKGMQQEENSYKCPRMPEGQVDTMTGNDRDCLADNLL